MFIVSDIFSALPASSHKSLAWNTICPYELISGATDLSRLLVVISRWEKQELDMISIPD
jgi:hypothetical protein